MVFSVSVKGRFLVGIVSLSCGSWENSPGLSSSLLHLAAGSDVVAHVHKVIVFGLCSNLRYFLSHVICFCHFVGMAHSPLEGVFRHRESHLLLLVAHGDNPLSNVSGCHSQIWSHITFAPKNGEAFADYTVLEGLSITLQDVIFSWWQELRMNAGHVCVHESSKFVVQRDHGWSVCLALVLWHKEDRMVSGWIDTHGVVVIDACILKRTWDACCRRFLSFLHATSGRVKNLWKPTSH